MNVFAIHAAVFKAPGFQGVTVYVFLHMHFDTDGLVEGFVQT